MIASETDRPSPTAALEAEAFSPVEVRALLDRGEAVLVDVREPFEHRAERIEGAINEPLEKLDARALRESRPGAEFIFHCRTGTRSATAADRFAAETGARGRRLEGGILAWKAAGLPTRRGTRAPIDVMRQMQITAGSLVVLGVALGLLVSPWFLGLSAFVGAGLVFAGASGWCGMAKLLAFMPWNRAR